MLVSIIVPVYNTEKYLQQCIESICSQSYRDLEVILIDDGSKDNSLSLCQAWAKKDHRIRVFTKKNEGQGKARNVGIDAASGDYILFVDSDDYIHKDMVRILVDAAYKYSSDLVQCKYREVSVNENYSIKDRDISELRIREEEQSGNERILCWYTDDIIPFNKLIKKELLADMRFPVGMYYEDKHLMFRVRHVARKIVYIDNELYFYVQSPSSTMRQKKTKKHYDSQLRCSQEILRYCLDNGLTCNYESEMAGYLRALLSMYYQTKDDLELRSYSEIAIEELKKYVPSWRTNKYLKKQYKFLVNAMSVNFDLTLCAFCVANKIRKLA